MKPPIQIIQASVQGKPATLVVLSPAPEKGVEPAQILGTVDLAGGAPAWDTFRPNQPFLELLGKYLRGELGVDLGDLVSARVEPGENFFVIDPRTPDPGGDVPPEDIVGAYETDEGGRPVLSTFRANPGYRVIDRTGAPSALLAERPLLERVLSGAP